MDSENILPRDQRLDPFIEEYGEEILFDIEAQRPGEHEVLDTDVELVDYKSFSVFSRFVEWDVLRLQDAPSREVIYRSMVFAYEVARIVHGDNAQFNAWPYIVHVMNSSDREECLRNDTQDYLAQIQMFTA